MQPLLQQQPQQHHRHSIAGRLMPLKAQSQPTRPLPNAPLSTTTKTQRDASVMRTEMCLPPTETPGAQPTRVQGQGMLPPQTLLQPLHRTHALAEARSQLQRGLTSFKEPQSYTENKLIYLPWRKPPSQLGLMNCSLCFSPGYLYSGLMTHGVTIGSKMPRQNQLVMYCTARHRASPPSQT